MIWRIRSRKVFAQLHSTGLRVRSGPLRMTFVAITTAEPQVAMAIGRRFGNAVERNRARRRIRAAFRQSWDRESTPNGAFLVTGGRSVLSMPFDTMVAATKDCLDQLAVRSSTVRSPTAPSPAVQAPAVRSSGGGSPGAAVDQRACLV